MKYFYFLTSIKLLSAILLLNNCKPINTNNNATNGGKWNGKKCAIALNYDDGLDVHLDNVIPTLNAFGFKGTFYVHTDASSFKNRTLEWKAISQDNHELGNHTQYHPCAGKSKGRKWVPENIDLDNYSYEKIINEIKTANNTLRKLDGKKDRTYAYTCGDTNVFTNTSYVPGVQPIFVSARGVKGAGNRLETINLYNLNAYSIDQYFNDDIIKVIDQAILNQELIILVFHGVGGGHDINISKKVHQKILNYIHKKEKDIWIDSMINISNYIKKSLAN